MGQFSDVGSGILFNLSSHNFQLAWSIANAAAAHIVYIESSFIAEIARHTHPSPTTTHLMACIVALRLCYPRIVDYPAQIDNGEIRNEIWQRHTENISQAKRASVKSPTPANDEWNICFSRDSRGYENVGDVMFKLDRKKSVLILKVTRKVSQGTSGEVLAWLRFLYQ